MKKYNVLRGGSWLSGRRLAASASRLNGHPDNRLFSLGFRVCTNSSPPRVVRGGSFLISAWLVRCAVRVRIDPGSRADNNGFRVVIED